MSVELLTVPETAHILRVRRARVYQLVRDGVIPSIRLGRQIRVDRGALLGWLRDGGQGLADKYRSKYLRSCF